MPDGATGTKRFYKDAWVEPGEGGYVLLLDGKPARTPARTPLSLPTRALGEAVAAEWDRQEGAIDPRSMPLTKLANSALDGVAREREAVRDDIARYAGSDLVLYRAAEPERLVSEQAAAWDPVLAFARDELGARFILAGGVIYVVQPQEALASIRAVLDRETSPFVLGGLHLMTTLSGSALIALMQAAGRLSVADAWRAAHVDELYQESLWGQDWEALRRREAREAEFTAAARTVALARE